MKQVIPELIATALEFMDPTKWLKGFKLFRIGGDDALRQSLKVSDKQLGHKFAEHMDPTRAGYRTHAEYRQRAEQVFRDPNARITRYPNDSPRYAGEIHYQVGDDLLRLDPSGNFRSLYPVN